MKSYTITASYHTSATGRVEFPDGKSWADVKDWYIKWDILRVLFNGEEVFREFELNSSTSDGTDWKRPLRASVYAEDENGDCDYDEEVASQG